MQKKETTRVTSENLWCPSFERMAEWRLKFLANLLFFLDGIPNGGQTITKGGSLPRQTWKNPSYHGMYQS